MFSCLECGPHVSRSLGFHLKVSCLWVSGGEARGSTWCTACHKVPLTSSQNCHLPGASSSQGSAVLMNTSQYRTVMDFVQLGHFWKCSHWGEYSLLTASGREPVRFYSWGTWWTFLRNVRKLRSMWHQQGGLEPAVPFIFQLGRDGSRLGKGVMEVGSWWKVYLTLFSPKSWRQNGDKCLNVHLRSF